MARPRGKGTGAPPGRRPEKTKPNLKVAETDSVEVKPDGTIDVHVEEFVRDPMVDEMASLPPIPAPEPMEMVEIPNSDNDRLMYLDYENGATIDEISHRWRVPAAEVKRRVDAAHAMIVQELEDGDGMKLRARHDITLRRMAGLALREFVKSQGQRKRVTRRQGIVGDKETDVTEVVTEDSQPGDPRFLHVALECNKQLSALWGTEAPKRVERVNVDVVHLDVSQLDEGQLERMSDAYRMIEELQRKQAGKLIDADASRKD